jgi:putative peptidoglycan lipid II flippase
MESVAKNSSFRLAGIIGSATILSKVVALLRDQIIAYSFGTTAGADAFNYAYKLPGFMLTLLGGVNGPFYSAVVSVIGRRKSQRVGPLMETLNTLTTVVMGAVAIGLWFGAPLLIGLVANKASLEIQQMAISQLRIMAPMAVLSGLIGLGFGVLTTAKRFALPSLSPILSSLAVIVAVLLFGHQDANILAWGVLIGALLQWLVQLPLQAKLGLGKLRLRWGWRNKAVKEFVSISAPAAGSSLLSNLNVYTDLFFASQLRSGVPSALGYANLLVQAPLGILSNILLIPALPAFSRLASPEDWPELRIKIRETILTVCIIVLPLSALTVALAVPVVSTIYERGQFTAADSLMTAQVFVGSALGMVFYLSRDMLIRVFYALGEAKLPLRISLIGIGVNLTLDWTFIQFFGPAGLTLSTTGVSALACILLIFALHKRLGRLGWAGLGGTLFNLLIGAILTGLSAWGVYNLLATIWPMAGIFPLLVKLTVATIAGVSVEILWILLWSNREVGKLLSPLLRRIFRRGAKA